MPARPLQERAAAFIRDLAEAPDDIASFRGYRQETLAVEPWMAEALREAEARIRRLRISVEQQLADTTPRPCAKCRKPVIGRADRKYCSDTCRQGAHRRRQAPKLPLDQVAPSLARLRNG